MNSERSVTQWIGSLKEQDDEAAQRLYSRYVERLLGLARKKLAGWNRLVADEEDIALIAMNSAIRGIQEGRFARLNDRDDLWQILAMLVDRKVIDQTRWATAEKRGYGVEMGESVLSSANTSDTESPGMGQFAGPDPSPEFVTQFSEELDSRLSQLEDDDLRKVALWKMEGFANAEIAERLGCVERTVERKLRVIRSIWTEE